MTRSSSLFRRMQTNPRGDWTISDVESVCRAYGIGCEPPRGGGSHYKITHSSQASILTIPYKRPIKAVYIRKLIAFIDAVENET